MGFTNNFNELRYGNINGAYNYEGIGFYLVEDGRDGAVPLYRYYQDEVQNHFYTTNVAEIGVVVTGLKGRHGYVYEGNIGYCYPEAKKKADMVPLHRFSTAGNHHYTINKIEFNNLLRESAWNYEGVQCYVYEHDMVHEDDYWRLKKRSCCNIAYFVVVCFLH